MIFNTFMDISDMGGLITEVGSIFTSCFNFLMGNWLLRGVIVVAVGIPVIAAVFSLIKSRF